MLRSGHWRSRLTRRSRRLAQAGLTVLLAAGLLGAVGLLARQGVVWLLARQEYRDRDQARAAGTRPQRSPAVAWPVGSGSAGWVARENQRPGTTAWRITDLGAADAVEGYTDHVSAQRGDRIRLFASTSRAALLVQNAVTTWQAYNLWGGFDLYQGPGGAFSTRSRVVSFDRPYGQAGQGAGDFLGNEYPLVRLVESLGLDVTYWTDVDLHERPAWLRRHRALVSLGHDEYWSTAMRGGAEVARDRGVNLAFLGANAVFRHIRLAPSPLGADREEINYKPQSARSDPAWRTDPKEVTTDWREPPLDDPESTLLGDLYECNPVDAAGVVVDPSAWVLAGTGVQPGTRLPGLIGPEYDRVQAGAPRPAGVELLLHSPLRCRGHASLADVTYYTAQSGAGVFDTGTSSWVCQLDAACADHRNAPATARVVRQATVNLLRAFAEGRAGRGWPTRPNLSRFHIAPSGL